MKRQISRALYDELWGLRTLLLRVNHKIFLERIRAGASLLSDTKERIDGLELALINDMEGLEPRKEGGR